MSWQWRAPAWSCRPPGCLRSTSDLARAGRRGTGESARPCLKSRDLFALERHRSRTGLSSLVLEPGHPGDLRRQLTDFGAQIGEPLPILGHDLRRRILGEFAVAQFALQFPELDVGLVKPLCKP